ncbi:tetratricopeptide repeat protein [Hyphomonas atlantica]|uniref:Uncharacterized protein n=1 Tax=Hyphomonas atlantica TaxID=1280948 RepID=A0A059E144_9PROT|nr:tetratricopeptide repeat protein [Hyphomonas atlantica]KCZ60683.1 hypothetical protein HY36_17475 [Hyphomonas atlantica]
MTHAPDLPDPDPATGPAQALTADLFAQARTALQSGELATCAQTLHRLLEIFPDHVPARRLSGHACLRLGKPDRAAAAYRRVLDHQPHCEDSRLGLGHALLRLGQTGQALAIYRDLVRHHPDSWRGYMSIADATPDEAERLNALSASADLLTRIHAEVPSRQILFACVNARINLREAGRALGELRETGADLTGDPGLSNLASRAAYFAGDFASAFQYKVRALTGLTPKKCLSAEAQSPCLPPNALSLARPLIDRLRAAGLILVPLAGTLLGAIRTQGLIETDRDIDLGILRPEGCHADMVDIVRTAPGLCLNRHARPGDRYLPVDVAGVSVDLFRLDRDNDHFCFGFSDRPGDVQWRLPAFAPLEEDAQGLARLDRDCAHACLRALYGPGWRVPDPYFSSATQSPALYGTDLHVRAYYAAHRARNALLLGQSAKAWHLICSSPLPIPLSRSRFETIWGKGSSG